MAYITVLKVVNFKHMHAVLGQGGTKRNKDKMYGGLRLNDMFRLVSNINVLR